VGQIQQKFYKLSACAANSWGRKIGPLIAVAAKWLGLKLNLLASELQVMTSHLHVLTT
jgi:hypothetical protein